MNSNSGAVRHAWLQTALLCIISVPAPPATAAVSRLLGSTVVRLELQENLTSAYTQPESPVFFRVVDDVLADGAVVIRKGTLVTGKITNIGTRQMQGVSGTVGLDVRSVPAVDGQLIRVIASTTRTGRSRDGAMVGWSLLWGIGALFTHGVNAHIERGTILEAQVLSDRRVDVSVPTPVPAAEAAALSSEVLSHRILASSSRQLRMNLEKNPVTGVISFKLRWPEALAADPLASIELVAVNSGEVPVPEPGQIVKGEEVAFGPWNIAQYCVNGTNAVRLRATSQSGIRVDFIDSLEVSFTR